MKVSEQETGDHNPVMPAVTSRPVIDWARRGLPLPTLCGSVARRRPEVATAFAPSSPHSVMVGIACSHPELRPSRDKRVQELWCNDHWLQTFVCFEYHFSSLTPPQKIQSTGCRLQKPYPKIGPIQNPEVPDACLLNMAFFL